jgi:hypothetical protein
MREMVYSNTLAVKALVEVLSDKRTVANNDVPDRVRELQNEGQAKRKKKGPDLISVFRFDRR